MKFELVNVGGVEIVTKVIGEQVSWIPSDPNNSDYAEYLRYTEWVKAGNKPEDFWAQNSDI